MNHYPHHIGDYRRDTCHLSLLEHGIYRQLLDTYYLSEAPIPRETNPVFRRLRAETEAEQKAVMTVLMEFFVDTPEGWRHTRCDLEIERYRAKAEQAKLNGIKGGRPSKPTKTNPVSDRFLKKTKTKANQEPRTNNQEPIKNVPTANAVGVPDGTPAPEIHECPHQKIIALYHEILPDSPRIIEWNDTRAGYMRSRWREKSKPSGSHLGYETLDEGLAFWRRYFQWCAQSDFLTGRSEGKDGKPPFVADLEWLIRPTNFAKVIEGRYHNR